MCLINDETKLIMRHEDQIPSKALLLEAYDPIIGINIANMCVGAIGICLNILVITAFSKLAPSARKKSVNILLFQQAFVDLFGSIFYSVGRYVVFIKHSGGDLRIISTCFLFIFKILRVALATSRI